MKQTVHIIQFIHTFYSLKLIDLVRLECWIHSIKFYKSYLISYFKLFQYEILIMNIFFSFKRMLLFQEFTFVCSQRVYYSSKY